MWNKKQVFYVVLIACVITTIIRVAFHYRLHLMYVYMRYRHELKPVPFESRQIPYVPVPATWVQHHFGKMELSLPSEFHIDNDVFSEESTVRHYRYETNGETKGVIISFPQDYSDMLVMTKLMPNTQLRDSISTLPRLRYECYRTASTPFNWAMSPPEVNWYIQCAVFSKLLRVVQDENAEFVFNDEMDKLLMSNAKRTVFEWQCKKTSLGGYIHFYDGNETEINTADTDWIRAVCQSLKIIELDLNEGEQ